MLIDVGYEGSLEGVTPHAKECEASGRLAGLWLSDTNNDPFLVSQLALTATTSLEVGTNIVVAFARSPFVVAQTAWNLAALSGGRFSLGLGPQVKAHIEKRFSMTWPSHAADAMAEYLDLLRHLFGCFRDGSRPQFRGEHYRCTLLSPVFRPQPHEHGDPPLGISAVGPKMSQVAGAKADNVFLHPFTHRKYLDEVTVPALDQGRAERSQDLEPLKLVGSCFVVATDLPEVKSSTRKVLERLAFYASTPNYKGVLDSLGLSDLHTKLHQMSRRGEWGEMARQLPEDLIEACVVRAPAADLQGALEERFADLYHRIVIDASQLR